MAKIRILVLCTGNSCRSQIAEGFFRQLGGDRIEVYSAGLEPKGVNPRAVQVMSEVGVDISRQSSDHVSKYLGQSFDYVITVCDNAAANCPSFPGEGARLHWPFKDPAEATGSEDQIMETLSPCSRPNQPENQRLVEPTRPRPKLTSVSLRLAAATGIRRPGLVGILAWAASTHWYQIDYQPHPGFSILFQRTDNRVV